MMCRILYRAASIASLSALTLAPAAQANPAGKYSDEFERPYGYGYGQEQQAYDARTRDVNGNRIIIDGRMVVGDDLSSLSTSGVFQHNYRGWGSGLSQPQSNAIGNQLNVITNGDHNTIVIDNTQINNGNQSVVLNGELDLND